MPKPIEHVTQQPLDDPKAEKLAHLIGYLGLDYASAAVAAGMTYRDGERAQAAVSYKMLNTPFAQRVMYWRRRRENEEAAQDAVMQNCAVVNEAYVIHGLNQVYKRAMLNGDLSVAREALVDLGKTCGMFASRSMNQNRNIDMVPEEEQLSEVDWGLDQDDDDGGTVH